MNKCTGLIKVGNYYVNPSDVRYFSSLNGKNTEKTCVSWCSISNKPNIDTRKISRMAFPHETGKSVFNCSVEKFADAYIEAQSTGKIIDVQS